MRDGASITESASVAASCGVSDGLLYKVKARVEKYHGPVSHDDIREGRVQPYETVEAVGNLLLRGGASILWECLKGSGSTASTAAKKYFNATAAIGVGTSTVAAAATQTALQGGSQSLKALTGGFPTHTTGSTAATVVDIVYKSTWGVTEGNFAWQEWGLFNKATTGNRRMFNRKVQSFGTKTSAASWTLTATFSAA